MKTLALLSLSLAVALGMPPFVPDVVQNPVLTADEGRPLLGDWVPVQGHVVVEDPAPQVRPGSVEKPQQKEKMAPVPADMEQVELEIKVEPQDGEGGVKTEVKSEPEVEVEQELKAKPEVEPEPKVKVEQEVKVEPQEKEPEVNLDPEFVAELKVDEKLDVKMEPELKDDPDFKVESEVKVEPDIQEESEERHIDMEGKDEMVNEPMDDDKIPEEELSDVELVEMEESIRAAFQNQDPVNQPVPKEEEEGLINVLEGEPVMELVNPQDEVEPEVMTELNDDPDFKADSEVKVEPDVLEEFLEVEEKHIDMEGKYEMLDEPIVNWELLDDDNMELLDKFQRQGPVNQELIMSEMDFPLDGEPVMELLPLDDDDDDVPAEKLSTGRFEMVDEPIMELLPLEEDNAEMSEVEKSSRTAFQNQDPEDEEGPIMELVPEEEEVMPEAAIMGEGPVLDIMGQPIQPLEGCFLNEEAGVAIEDLGSELEEQQEVSHMGIFEDSVMEDRPVFDGGVQIGEAPERERRALRQGLSPIQGLRSCPGVVLEEKCYQFFKGPKKAVDAEFFCQDQFPGGHLASITSQHVHREVMSMMLRQNQALTRTWVGGLRYLESGRFIWLDGSHWGYADWLSGEPNNTADVEDCVELLAYGGGKFNDFTCWEPQAFICSYPY